MGREYTCMSRSVSKLVVEGVKIKNIVKLRGGRKRSENGLVTRSGIYERLLRNRSQLMSGRTFFGWRRRGRAILKKAAVEVRGGGGETFILVALSS